MATNALVHAYIRNNIHDADPLRELAMKTGGNKDTQEQNNDQINSLLTDTIIKRACCMNKAGTANAISVKIPVPKGYNLNNSSNPTLQKKFNYITKSITVPTSYCTSRYPDYTKGSESCNHFYEAYCQNEKAFYKKENGNRFDQIEWTDYNRECACYGDINPGFEAYPGICYMHGCSDNNLVYFDNASRQVWNQTGVCPLNLCQSIIEVGDIENNGEFNWDSSVVQNCTSNYTKEELEAGKAPAPAPEAPETKPEAPETKPEEEEPEEPPPPPESNLLLILCLICICLLILSSIGAIVYYFMTKKK